MPRGVELEIGWTSRRGELDMLADEWRRLWRECSTATPFSSPDWALAWLDCFGGVAPRILMVRREGELVGLLPGAVSLNAGERGQPVLELLGAAVSDYQDVLVAPELDAAVVAAVWEAIWQRAEWERAEFRNVPPWSQLLRETETRRADESREVFPGEVCPVLDLGDAGQSAIPESWAKRLAYDERRLRRMGEVTVVAATTETRREMLNEVRRLHAARWRPRGQAGVLADGAVAAFHERTSEAFLRAGVLKLHVLRVDGRTVAGYYGFQQGNRAYYYLSGFDPAFERFGVGNLVVAHAIDDARREGVSAFDFLRGQEPYKYRWGARDQPTFRLIANHARATAAPHS